MKAATWRINFALVLGLGISCAYAIESTKDQWSIATDVQKYYSCLPFDWYVVRPVVEGKATKVGDLVQFIPPAQATLFSDRFEVIKIVAAVSGDRWRIEEDQLYVNGDHWGKLHLLDAIGAKPGALDGGGTVPERHVLVLGTNPSSYDSRYWGPLPVDQITGSAYVIF